MAESGGVRVLTRRQMLDLWRLVRHFEPLRADAAVTRTDGVDLDEILEVEIDRWYDEALRTLPADVLPTEDLSGEVAVTCRGDGVGVVALPERCLRVVTVCVDGWGRAATVVTDPDSPLGQEQSNVYTRGGCENPVAVVSGGEMMLYTPPAGTKAVSKLVCVTEPPEGMFRLTPAMLPVPRWDV